jgi:hypothetical protein
VFSAATDAFPNHGREDVNADRKVSRLRRLMLLCQAEGDRDLVRGGEEVVDPADEVAFEAADRFALGFAALALFGDVDRGLGVVADSAEGEHVDRVVELTVAAAV